MTRCVALLGGSFDPVHHGHVALAELFARLLNPDELRLLPAGQPWQKSNGLQAGDTDRIRMLELAFAGSSAPVTIDTREIARRSPTYTVDTLRELRAELGPEAAIVFLMGADQLQKLDTWRDWESLFALASFAVAARPGYRLDEAALPLAVAREVAARRVEPGALCASAAGKVCIVHTLAVDISATQVREALKQGGESGKESDATDAGAQAKVGALLSPQVLDYIQQHNLYKS